MSDFECAIRPILVGNHRYPLYVIADARFPFAPSLYWTGRGETPWTADVSKAMKWADYGAVMEVFRGKETAEPDDSAGGN